MEWIYSFLTEKQMDTEWAIILSYSIVSAVILAACIVANWITKKIVLRIITLFITKNRIDWDDKLVERQVFQKLSHIVPAIIIYYGANVYADFPVAKLLIEKAAVIYILLVVLSALNAFINAINDIYNTYEISKTRPIKGILQVIKIIIFFIGAILC